MLSAPLFTSTEAEAGPLLNWLRGRRSPCTCQQPTAYNYYGANQVVPTTAQYAPNAAGLQPGQCMRTCNKTCTRTVVNYVPYTAYRTTWKRVPVTTYRPVTNSDPCTGCKVTCMRPCTTYTYQMQRVPYTTQRPVYRTETYQVPVTTITNDCANGNCNVGCNTCNTGVQGVPQQGFSPTLASPPVSGTSSTGSTYVAPSYDNSADRVPANQTPALGSQSRISVPNGTLTTTARYQGQQPANVRPTVAIPRDFRSSNQSRSAKLSPVQRKWDYSPVRLASYNQPASDRVPVRSVRTQPTQRKSIREINSIWNDVN